MKCGAPMKGGAKSAKAPTARAAAPQPKSAAPKQPAVPPAQKPVQPTVQSPAPQGMMPQNPQMMQSPAPQGMMPQNPQMMQSPAPQGMMPQNPQMMQSPVPQGMMPQNPQMMQNPVPQGMMPQNPQMMQSPAQPENAQNPQMMQNPASQGMIQPQMMGMMQPQMMGMMQPQMMGMMPQTQFMGYDPNGIPIYMQMVPQVVGYDAYGNPMYTMVPVQTYGMPQMQGMMQPQMGMMPQNPAMPQMQPMQAAPMPQAPPPPPAEVTMQVASYAEVPVSAESLMHEDEETDPSVQLPDETELLDQIFSTSPRHNTMSVGTKPSAQTFSISLSASEITSVRDEEPASPPKKQKTKEAKNAEPPVKKPPQRIVSPDEFFGDTSPAAQRMKKMNVDTPMIEDDEALEAQIAALEAEGHKKSKRSMQAADNTLDAQAAVEDPSVSAAAQAILAQDNNTAPNI